ncbi:MAG: CBS domain-containing protein [Bdellovibrionota bacterium]
MKKPTVTNNMTRSIITVRWNLPMNEALEIMEQRSIRHLPVLGDDGKLVGVISDRDVKRAMDPDTSEFSADCRVGDYMNWPVIAVEQSDSLVGILDIMIEQKISAMVITKNGGISGIITSEDLMKLLRELLMTKGDNKNLTLLDLQYKPYIQEAIREADAAGI